MIHGSVMGEGRQMSEGPNVLGGRCLVELSGQ